MIGLASLRRLEGFGRIAYDNRRGGDGDLVRAQTPWKAPADQRGSISAPGMRRASFFDQSPPVPVFAPPHQTICPQDVRGDVAFSDLVPLLLGTPEKAGVM